MLLKVWTGIKIICSSLKVTSESVALRPTVAVKIKYTYICKLVWSHDTDYMTLYNVQCTYTKKCMLGEALLQGFKFSVMGSDTSWKYARWCDDLACSSSIGLQ